MLTYMIIFKECFGIAQLIRFKTYSFETPFPNTKVPGWGVTQTTMNDANKKEARERAFLFQGGCMMLPFHLMWSRIQVSNP